MRKRLTATSQKADARLRLLVCAAVIFALNAAVTYRLFFIHFTSHMESTEGAFIAISRYATRHWGRLDWLPMWFTGMPFDNVYQPGFHLSVAALSTALGLTPEHVYHILAALVYCLGPVTLLVGAWHFTRRVEVAFVTALMYSVISPSCLLIRDIRLDTGGWLAYRRYLNVIKYADTPHLTVLVLVPLALIAVDLAVRESRWWAVPFAVMCSVAIVLTNWPGTVGFALVMLAYGIAITVRSKEKNEVPGTYFWRLAAIGIAAYLIACPWVPPWTLLSVQQQAQQSGFMSFGGAQVLYALAVMVAAAVLALLSRRLELWLRLMLLFLLFSGSVVMSRYWFGFQLLPQTHRWHPEMEVAFLSVIVCLASKYRAALIGLAVLSLALLPGVMRYANSLTRAIDMTKTTEYRIARWFDANSRNERVFVPGSVSMWMNNFTDVAQFAGCCDQGVPSFTHRVALYTVYTGQNAGRDYVPISTMWLQAYGVHAIAVTGPGSGEMFHPYAHPDEFRGQLPELWRDADDAIYEIPHLTTSLAHVVNSTDVVTREPKHGLDVGPLRQYVGALLSTAYPEASFRWTGTSRAEIETELHADQLVSLQVTYDRGWHAMVNAVEKPITRDALDLMLIHTATEGPCKIELRWEAPHRTELRAAAVLGAVMCCVVSFLVRRRTAATR